MPNVTRTKAAMYVLIWLSLTVASGCTTLTTSSVNGLDAYEIPKGPFQNSPPMGPNGVQQLSPHSPPAELSKTTLPDYVIEPPDVLIIESLNISPKNPYEVGVADVLTIVVLGTTAEQQIGGNYQVDGAGKVNLGPGYGSVHVAGLTTDEAQDAIRTVLLRQLANPEVAVSVFQSSGMQFVTGEHLVSPDGTVNLGLYGRVYVAGLTLDQAQRAIEERLAKDFEEPRVSVDVFVYNSKWYYIVAAGPADRVQRLPCTGNETVLDALAQVGGFDQTSSKKIWISRPSPGSVGCNQILPVDWDAITRGGDTSTNYQLFPGDRLFIADNPMVSLFSVTTLILNPFERIIGFALLGAQTGQTLQRFPEGFNSFR